jgi:hypothetical protein
MGMGPNILAFSENFLPDRIFERAEDAFLVVSEFSPTGLVAPLFSLLLCDRLKFEPKIANLDEDKRI